MDHLHKVLQDNQTPNTVLSTRKTPTENQQKAKAIDRKVY